MPMVIRFTFNTNLHYSLTVLCSDNAEEFMILDMEFRLTDSTTIVLEVVVGIHDTTTDVQGEFFFTPFS
jgi:hypothetical protein